MPSAPVTFRVVRSRSRSSTSTGTAGGIVPSPDQVAAEIRARVSVAAETAASPLIWSGTGLCACSQGDGVLCEGTAGTCETCGRALAVPA